MKEDESFDPMPVSFFGPEAIVFEANCVPNLIDELGLTHGNLSRPVSLTQDAFGQLFIYLIAALESI